MPRVVLTTDTMRDILRPVWDDAAESLEYGGYIHKQEALDWFESASLEALQEIVMYAAQRGVLAALDIAPLPDMDGIPEID